MTIGAGIALAAVWMLPVACAVSDRVNGTGLTLGMIVALLATAVLIHA